MLSFKRLKLLKRITFLDASSQIMADKRVEFDFSENSNIILKNSTLRIGYPLQQNVNYPSRNCTKIILEENAKLICHGNVAIAPGTSIRVCKNASLEFNGNNFIAHDGFIFSHQRIYLGRNTSVSWNVTLMDHDGHELYYTNGERIRKLVRELYIEDNVGIQMNVVVPRGVRIGENSLIAANSVIRTDIPSNTLVYSDHKLRFKPGITFGLQLISK